MADEVLGLWTFDGKAEEIADGTEFTNQVKNGTLSLKAKKVRIEPQFD